MYGIRKPLAPGNAPLIEGTPGIMHEDETRYGIKAEYWFVTPEQDIKVRLSLLHGDQEELTAFGKDAEKFFRVKIRKRK